MKKLILSVAAMAAMATAGGVYAQSADCARGMLGADPCGATGVVVPNPNYGDLRYERDWDHRNSRRWNEAHARPEYDRDGRRNPHRNDRNRPNVRNDRDRDGVRDNRDRFPDDRRRR